MGNTGSGARKKVNLCRIQLDTMGVPDVIARPAQILGVLPRTAAKFGQGLGDILVILSQMSVQHHTLVTRQNGGVAH